MSHYTFFYPKRGYNNPNNDNINVINNRKHMQTTKLEKYKALISAIMIDAFYAPTDNLDRIAKTKLMFFGTKLWVKCPCDPESDRACISKHCRQDIENDGICHCQLYMKRKSETETSK